MQNDNLELFDENHATVGALIDGLDNIADVVVLRKNWPKLLSEFIDLFHAELKRQGYTENNAAKTAPKLAAVLGNYFGGRVCYIPNGETLKLAIRDNKLFLDYQSSNGHIPTLAKKYNLTDSYVYSIIREQSALHRKRHQPDMFGESK